MNGRKKILFVEDDADDREMILYAVNEINPLVHTVFAENGLQAVEYLEQAKNTSLPCLVVLDLNLPLLDGKETYRKIKHELKLESLPVIVFSSSQNPNDKNLFASWGVEFITKPDNPSYLNKIVSHMLNVCDKN